MFFPCGFSSWVWICSRFPVVWIGVSRRTHVMWRAVRVFSPPVAGSLVLSVSPLPFSLEYGKSVWGFVRFFKAVSRARSFDVVSLGRSFANTRVFQIPNSCFPEALPLLVHQGAPRRPSYYNLQLLHEDHDVVGDMIFHSRTRWLYANEIIEILKHAHVNGLTKSIPTPPQDTIGLFIYDVKQYFDHRWWEDVVNRGLGKWKKVEENGMTMNMSESVRFLDEKYFKRVHRDSLKRFGNLAVVHYRRLP